MTVGAVRDYADHFLEQYCALDPIFATDKGEPGYDHLLPDFSPDGVLARRDLFRAALSGLDAVAVEGEEDRLCQRLLHDRIGAELVLVEADEPLRQLRILDSPIGGIRGVFDLMPRATVADWETLGRRLESVPGAYASFESALRLGAARGVMAPRRQAVACAQQLETWAGNGTAPFFVTLVTSAPDALRGRLEAAAARAAASQAALALYLRDEYAPATEQPDPAGRDRYVAMARRFLGAELDPDDAYAWGWDELMRIEEEMARVAASIVPGASLAEVMDHLDEHGDAVEGEDALRRWLQDLMDTTVAELDGRHFELAPPLHTIEAMISPPGTAAAQYYTSPSADFSRPGRTWYPTLGRTRFPLWGEWSTCYHEGVPGHHLQLAQWRYVAERLSRFQATVRVNGNIEGWALYAERLMDELGFFEEPGRRLGYLVAQQMRATRVVVDVGMHCEMGLPSGQPFHPGETMTPELGRQFLHAHAGKDDAFIESEFVRYLGWPGQAICYKLGERVWLAGRAAAQRAARDRFDLKGWHMAALSQGSLGLDALAEELPRLSG
jgi:uncharacterized protein (DUF885 family)